MKQNENLPENVIDNPEVSCVQLLTIRVTGLNQFTLDSTADEVRLRVYLNRKAGWYSFLLIVSILVLLSEIFGSGTLWDIFINLLY